MKQVENKEIEDFVTKLKEERSSINQKLVFVHEHKFTKESEYYGIRFKLLIRF